MIPRVLVITDTATAATAGRVPAKQAAAAATAGTAVGVLVRDKHLPRADRRRLAATLRGAAAWLAVASDITLASDVGADAVHLAAHEPSPDDRGAGLVVGRSCHSPADVRTAAEAGVDYVTLSPIFPPRSKPDDDRPCLTPDALADLPLPALALGGVEPGNAAACVAAGAAGVAVCGVVMTARDPAAIVHRLVEETTR